MFWWICLPKVMSAWLFKDTPSNGTPKVLISKVQFFCFSHSLTAFRSYLPSSRFIKLALYYHYCKEIAAFKKSTENVPYLPRHFKEFTSWIQWLLSENINPQWWDDSIHIIGYMSTPVILVWNSRQVIWPYWKEECRLTMVMSFHKERECRSIPAKPACKSCRGKVLSRTLKGIDEL